MPDFGIFEKSGQIQLNCADLKFKALKLFQNLQRIQLAYDVIIAFVKSELFSWKKDKYFAKFFLLQMLVVD